VVAPSPADRLRLVLADDCPALIDEIVALLAPEHTILDCVGDGTRLVDAVNRLHPDVVVSDINMPRLNGIDAARRLLDGGACRAFVLLTVNNDSLLVTAAVDAGIRGFVLKADAGEELSQAIRDVFAGATYFSRGISR